MEKLSTSYAVADYCRDFKNGDIVVNRDYQRSDKVWPPAARSYLIESILLGYPIPKLFLYPITDLKSKRTIKEIVDGQQRSQAIVDYYDNKFRISVRSEFDEAKGKLYQQLDEELQRKFLEYGLSVDLLQQATPEEIRESFRRINSYTVPLNPEEIRHAVYQGDFKWFINELSSKYDRTFENLGIFTNKQLIRMVDFKLLAEIIDAYLHGITNSSKKRLGNLYESFDHEFPFRDETEKRISNAIEFIIDLKEIHNGPLMKPYNIYSLILAINHVHSPIKTLNKLYMAPKRYSFKRDKVVSNLSVLAEAVENGATTGRYKNFVLANMSKTNGALHRGRRFKWFCKALVEQI
jgi:hypothetical protein